MKIILYFLFYLICHAACAAENDLNVYNWSGYLPEEILQRFEKETGIHVNYSTYDSNETLYAKLKADPRAKYDIVVPSTYFLDRMRQQNMLQVIDKKRLPNFSNLDPNFLNKDFDPQNTYSVPYLLGRTGIVVNYKYFPQEHISRWADLWQPQYRNQLLLLDDNREVFSMALLTLGYSINDTNPEHIHQAYNKLKTLLPNIRLFNAEAVKSIYIDEDAAIGMGWSGDIFLANQENPNIEYILPQEGYIVSLDSLAIPKNAVHMANAYRFINFLLRPEIAKQISLTIGFATPNLAAVKLMPAALRNNHIIYPTAEELKRGQFQSDVGTAAAIYEKYWELLKIGG